MPLHAHLAEDACKVEGKKIGKRNGSYRRKWKVSVTFIIYGMINLY